MDLIFLMHIGFGLMLNNSWMFTSFEGPFLFLFPIKLFKKIWVAKFGWRLLEKLHQPSALRSIYEGCMRDKQTRTESTHYCIEWNIRYMMCWRCCWFFAQTSAKSRNNWLIWAVIPFAYIEWKKPWIGSMKTESIYRKSYTPQLEKNLYDKGWNTVVRTTLFKSQHVYYVILAKGF